MKFSRLFTILSLMFFLASCAAVNTAVSKRNLEVQTKMSDTIFLDPVKQSLRTVYLQIRNTSDKSDFNITEEVKSMIRARGYKIITNDPDKAHYILQANILQVGKSSQTAAEQSLYGGYGDVAALGALGAAVGSYNGSSRSAIGGGLVGAGIGLVANSMVKDVYYSVITDLQISERVKSGKVRSKTKHKLSQGTSGAADVTYESTGTRKKYQTRVLSSANKVNLKWAEAEPELKSGIAKSISGMF